MRDKPRTVMQKPPHALAGQLFSAALPTSAVRLAHESADHGLREERSPMHDIAFGITSEKGGKMSQRQKRVAVFVLVGLWCCSTASSAQETKEAAPVFAAVYSRGPAWIEGKPLFEQPRIREHVQHFESLGDRLIGAAPFSPDPSDRAVGMVLLVAENEETARTWANADPAAVGKVMEVKLYPWRISRLRGCFERKR